MSDLTRKLTCQFSKANFELLYVMGKHEDRELMLGRIAKYLNNHKAIRIGRLFEVNGKYLEIFVPVEILDHE